MSMLGSRGSLNSAGSTAAIRWAMPFNDNCRPVAPAAPAEMRPPDALADHGNVRVGPLVSRSKTRPSIGWARSTAK
jgi:hypothetical protein